MRPRRYAFGGAEEATHPDSARATIAEFLSTFIFVFAAEGSVLAFGNIKLKSDHLLYACKIIEINFVVYYVCR